MVEEKMFMYKEKTVVSNEEVKIEDFSNFTKKPIVIQAKRMLTEFAVETKEGVMRGKAGDFLIIGIEGEMYPCDYDIFMKTYD